MAQAMLGAPGILLADAFESPAICETPTRMIRLVVAGLLSAASILIVPPASALEPPGLRIAAASDLRFALEELLAAFRVAHPDMPVEVSYGSSGNFFAQIREGAPFDMFLSADSEYTRRLAGEGLGEVPFPYAFGRLAVVVSKESGLDPRGFGDLLKGAAVRRLAIANPAHAPYGRAAEATLRAWKVHDLTLNKLVMGDSVSQAVQFVDSGAAQAGLVALSLVKAGSRRLSFAEVPERDHPPLDQHGTILKRTTLRPSALAFATHLTSEAGRAILARHGFGLPKR